MVIVANEKVFTRCPSVRIVTLAAPCVCDHPKMAHAEIRAVFDYEIRGKYISNVI